MGEDNHWDLTEEETSLILDKGLPICNAGHLYKGVRVCFADDVAELIKKLTQKQEGKVEDKYESVCKICFRPVKTEAHCWEKHIEKFHSNIEDRHNLEEFFMDLDLGELTALTGSVGK